MLLLHPIGNWLRSHRSSFPVARAIIFLLVWQEVRTWVTAVTSDGVHRACAACVCPALTRFCKFSYFVVVPRASSCPFHCEAIQFACLCRPYHYRIELARKCQTNTCEYRIPVVMPRWIYLFCSSLLLLCSSKSRSALVWRWLHETFPIRIIENGKNEANVRSERANSKKNETKIALNLNFGCEREIRWRNEFFEVFFFIISSKMKCETEYELEPILHASCELVCGENNIFAIFNAIRWISWIQNAAAAAPAIIIT